MAAFGVGNVYREAGVFFVAGSLIAAPQAFGQIASAAGPPPDDECHRSLGSAGDGVGTTDCRTWGFHLVTEVGWEYDVFLTTELRSAFADHVRQSPPGKARFAGELNGSVEFEAAGTISGRDAPELGAETVRAWYSLSGEFTDGGTRLEPLEHCSAETDDNGPDEFDAGFRCDVVDAAFTVAATDNDESDVAGAVAILNAQTVPLYYSISILGVGSNCVITLFTDDRAPISRDDGCTVTGSISRPIVYHLTALGTAAGSFAGFALYEPTSGLLFLGTDTELTALDQADAVLTTMETTGRTFVVSVGEYVGVRPGDLDQLAGFPNDLDTYQIPGSMEGTVITISGGAAVERTAG